MTEPDQYEINEPESKDSLQKPKQNKKPRSAAQLEAFEKAKLKRLESLAVKRSQIKVKEEEIQDIKKTKPGTKAGEKLEKLNPTPAPKPAAKPKLKQPEPDSESDDEVIVVRRPKKKKKKVIVVEDDESSDDEVVVKKPQPIPTKRQIMEPIPPPQYNIKFV